MNARDFAGLRIAWTTGDLPVDPIEPVLPLSLGAVSHDEAAPSARVPDLTIVAALAQDREPNPAERGATPVLFHGKTRCFIASGELVLWDGASTLRVSNDGRRIDAQVHRSSLQQLFHFSSVSVMMALLLALRHHGLFHLHAACARWPDGHTWLLPGESGSGKSTLALAAFAAGAQWLSDDAVLLRAVARELEVVGWARMIRITSRTADAFPALRPLLTPCPQGSARDWELDPRVAFPDRGVACTRGSITLLHPSITDTRETQLVPLDNADAFGRTLHACAWVASEHLPQRSAQLSALAQLIDHARAFELQAGTQWLNDPIGAVSQLRAQLASRVTAK